jgi:hypothetical protein
MSGEFVFDQRLTLVNRYCSACADAQEIARLDAVQPLLAHEHLRRILKTAFN